MKTYLLFALIFVVGFALVNGHKGRRHRGREQSAGSYAGMSRMMAGMPTKQRTMGGYRQALKKFKKFGIGGKHFTMGKQMMMGGFAFKPGRTDKPVPPFRKLKLCSTECRDECANFTTCRQDCNDRCGEGKQYSFWFILVFVVYSWFCFYPDQSFYSQSKNLQIF